MKPGAGHGVSPRPIATMVRFIYMHERDWYLSLSDKKDTIEFLSGDLDITGWDLKKSLQLLKKSNVPLIERFQSPIMYSCVPGFKEEFRQLIDHYYSPAAVFFHHYSLAKKFWETINMSERYRLKDWFYLVRSLLSCNWIIQDKAVLPMNIEPLMTYVAKDIQRRIQELILLKSEKNEKYLHECDTDLSEWISELMRKLEAAKEQPAVNNNKMEKLDKFFIKKLYA